MINNYCGFNNKFFLIPPDINLKTSYYTLGIIILVTYK